MELVRLCSAAIDPQETFLNRERKSWLVRSTATADRVRYLSNLGFRPLCRYLLLGQILKSSADLAEKKLAVLVTRNLFRYFKHCAGREV